MGLIMPLDDRDDVGGTEAITAKEIIERIARLGSFERVDLLPNKTVGIGGAVVANVFAPRNGDTRAAGLGVEDAIVGFREGAVIDPDVADRAAVTKIDEVPIVLVVIALAGFIPFPHLVELQIADDDVGRGLDVEGRMADGRAVRRKDRET